jgi:hypothetical protein
MLAERDPIATAMKAKYRNLPMPNLGLGEDETADVIDFMKTTDAARKKATDAASKKASKPH